MFGRLKLWLAGAGAALLALAGIYLAGRRDARQDARTEALEGYQDTRKRMDEVPVDDDPAILRDWLLERGKPKRDL